MSFSESNAIPKEPKTDITKNKNNKNSLFKTLVSLEKIRPVIV